MLYCAGVVAADVVGHEAALGDIAAETRVVLGALARLLADHGSSLAQVVRADVHIADIALKPAMDAAYAEFFASTSAPARTTVAVSGLYGGCLVEITLIAGR